MADILIGGMTRACDQRAQSVSKILTVDHNFVEVKSHPRRDILQYRPDRLEHYLILPENSSEFVDGSRWSFFDALSISGTRRLFCANELPILQTRDDQRGLRSLLDRSPHKACKFSDI
jgi:hypothetical protein